MGDRCECRLTYRKEDEPKYMELPGDDLLNLVQHEGSTWRTIYLEQVNYGLLSDRERFASNGLCFLGEHGAGGSYLPAKFVAFKGEHVDVAAFDGQFVVFLDEKGIIDGQGITDAWRYMDLLKKPEEALGLTTVIQGENHE